MANPYYQPNYQSGGFYPPNYFQPTMPMGQPAQTQTAPQDDRIWVASEAAADVYQMVPGGFVRLWDSNKPVFYEKRADMTGRPMPLVAYEYKIRDANAAPEAVSAGFEQRLTDLEEKVRQLAETKRQNVKAEVKRNDA